MNARLHKNVSCLAMLVALLGLSASTCDDPSLSYENSNSMLWRGLHSNSEQVVSRAVELGADVNAQAIDSLLPLNFAVAQGYSDLSLLLLKAGADPNLQDGLQKTAIDEVFLYPNTHVSLHMMEILLRHGANPNFRRMDESLLYWAVKNHSQPLCLTLLEKGAIPDAASLDFTVNRRQDIELSELLLKHGANPNEVGAGGESVLQSYFDDSPLEQMLVLLVKHGGSPNLTQKANGRPMLGWSALQGSQELTALLLSKGANPATLLNSYSHQTIKEWVDKNASQSIKDLFAAKLGQTGKPKPEEASTEGIADALIRGDQGAAIKLARQGVDPNRKSASGEWPLFIAVEKKYCEVVKELLIRGAYVNARNQSAQNQTALHIAASIGDPCIVRALLGNKADVEVMNNEGDTALDLAAKGGQGSSWKTNWVDVVRALLDAGARGDKQKQIQWAIGSDLGRIIEVIFEARPGQANLDPNMPYTGLPYEVGSTLLSAAIFLGKLQAAKALLKLGADANHATGTPTLHVAAGSANYQLVELILNAGGDPNKTYKSQTPLQVLLEKSSILKNYELAAKFIKLFHSKKADFNWRDPFGRTVLHYAAQDQANDIYADLLKVGAKDNIKDTYGRTPKEIMFPEGDKKKAEKPKPNEPTKALTVEECLKTFAEADPGITKTLFDSNRASAIKKVKKANHKLQSKYHPDKCEEEDKPECSKKSIWLNQCQDCLNDPDHQCATKKPKQPSKKENEPWWKGWWDS